MIRYGKKGSESNQTESDSLTEPRVEESREKKDRSKERTIGESI